MIINKEHFFRRADLGATFICKSKIAGMMVNIGFALLKSEIFFLTGPGCALIYYR
jgi:hypothetical protein